jgi:tetratricopeptide (TPR) repeat protein
MHRTATDFLVMKTALLVLLLSASALASDMTADRLKEVLEERAANARAARLIPDQRIDFYRSLVTAKPQSSRYKVLLAASFLQKMRETTDFGYVARASKVLDEVLTADPSNYDALCLRAQIQLEYHFFAKAADTARQLIAIRPNDPLNWGALADALTEMGDYDAAGDTIQKMVDLRPDLASYNRAAHYRFLHNDATGAIDIMKRAISAGSSAPENVAWCLNELGDMYFKTGRVTEARNAYEAALQAFPRSHKSWASLGRLQAATGDAKAAIDSYRHAQSITPLPDYAAALFDLKSDPAKQRATVELIDQLAVANNEKVNRNLSLIFSDHGWRLERALQLAKAELDFRRDVYTYDALAWAYFKNGDLAKAEEAMGKALKLGTPEPQFYYHASVIANAQGKSEFAAAYRRRATDLNPLWPGLRETIEVTSVPRHWSR